MTLDLDGLMTGKPVVLQARAIKSGWNPQKEYRCFLVAVPVWAVRAMGAWPGMRLVPYYDPENRLLIYRPAPLQPPEV